MATFIANRILRSIIVLLLISVVTFTFIQISPGDPFSADAGGRPRSPEIQEKLRRQYGFDRPPVEQYFTYMNKVVFHFDLGPSLRQKDFTINQLMFGVNFWEEPFRAPVMTSAQLGFLGFSLAVFVGIPIGIIAALYHNKLPDFFAMFFATFGISIPNFVLGLILILVFALGLGWFDVYGWGEPRQMVLPVVTLGTGGTAIIARLTRASMLEVLGQDYVRTARSKGLSEQVVMVRHALSNSLIPVVTILGPLLAAWLTGTFLVEHVFAVPGIGRYFVSAVTDRDYMLIMATILFYSVVLVTCNLIVDILYGYLDPRIRYD